MKEGLEGKRGREIIYPFPFSITQLLNVIHGHMSADCRLILIGGKSETLGLEGGDYLGLPTEGESWGFSTFTVDACCDRIVTVELSAVVIFYAHVNAELFCRVIDTLHIAVSVTEDTDEERINAIGLAITEGATVTHVI